MLADLKDKIQRLESFDFAKEQETIIEDNKGKLTDLQRKQLYAGADRNDKPILLDGRGYSPRTIEIKKAKGQRTDVVTWKDTGELYATLETIIVNGTFEITSNNFKFGIMMQRSGQDTVGLDDSSKQDFAQNTFMPQFKEVFKRKTGLGIS